MHVVTKIHNNSLSRIFQVVDEQAGIAAIKKSVEEQLDRELEDDEIKTLENDGEFYNDEDFENIYCWSLSFVEPEPIDQ